MNYPKIIDAILLISVYIFLFNYFPLGLMLSETITSGGDTASHYYSAYYMKEYLLPKFRLTGWSMGAYAGAPLFQFYFPLPFLLIALLGYAIPLQIAFKLITILGVFLLPALAYFSFRLFGLKFPMPITGAMFTLPFLFNQGNSMWGGNIPSTLAGEFTYSIGLALAVLFFGLVYKGVNENKYLVLNILLLSTIALNHIYTLFFAGFASLFFLKNIKNWKYMLKIYITSFLLIGFWVIPLIAKLKYTSPYADAWNVSFWEVFPNILWPLIALFFVSFLFYIIRRKDKKKAGSIRILDFLLFSIFMMFILYWIAPYIGVVNIRFLPFIQLLVVLFSSFLVYFVLESKYTKNTEPRVLHVITLLTPVILFILTVALVGNLVTYIPAWIQWNYSGFEAKELWLPYKGVNEFLKGGVNEPRVVYEHSQEHNRAGTPRAFESLPLFSGRSTLEGVYMQSILNAPYIFYIQSEISKEASCPFPNRRCTNFNLEKGAKHLNLYNVREFIAITDKVKEALRKDKNYKLVKTAEPYEVYELQGDYSYIVVPKHYPISVNAMDFYEQFKWLDFEEFPVIYDAGGRNAGLIDFSREPKIIDGYDKCIVAEQIKEEEILFNTSCVGLPHLIKISYFPNWKVEGAKKIEFAAPAFMLVYPDKETVRLYYGRTLSDNIGFGATILGVLCILFLLFKRNG